MQGIIVSGGTNTRIGGTAAGAENVISGNDGHGVWLVTSLSDNNVVEGNFIGTDAAGDPTLGNRFYGVVVSNGSSNRIGGTAAGAGNVILVGTGGALLPARSGWRLADVDQQIDPLVVARLAAAAPSPHSSAISIFLLQFVFPLMKRLSTEFPG